MYRITLSKKQLELLASVLEQHARIMCGHVQVNTMPALERAIVKESKGTDEFITKSRDVNQLLNDIKRVVWSTLGNGNYGLGYDNESDMAYEMYKMIKHQREKELKEEQGDAYKDSVHTSLPLHYSDEELIEIEKL